VRPEPPLRVRRAALMSGDTEAGRHAAIEELRPWKRAHQLG
jgi:hypothetical protein